MSTLLVTGGAGFIGSNFIRYWLEKYPEDSIVNFDALTYAGNLENLKDIQNNAHYTFIKGDICNEEHVSDAVKDVDSIVHFAAESHVDRSIQNPKSFIETNVQGTYTLLEAARTHSVHMHHISTDEVFGALPLESEDIFNEKTPYVPRSPYAASKAASDHIVRAYHVTYGLPVTITNCSNNFGPYQHPEKFISRMITNLIDGSSVKIYGDGKYVRDWLHVWDHCTAIDRVLKEGVVGETYLVGGMKEEVNNLEVAHMILEYMGYGEGRIEYVKDRPGHDRRYAVDWSKMHKELGWEPEYDFKEWLHKTIDWYTDNEWWWRPLKEQAERIYI